MRHVDHIGIAVKDIDISIPLFEKLMNAFCYKKEIVEDQKIQTAFLKTGETKIELLGDLNADGTINKFIEKRGEGIHHIAFEVDDIKNEISRLKKQGFIFINEQPTRGADNKIICFLHPKSTNSILIELCQEINSA